MKTTPFFLLILLSLACSEKVQFEPQGEFLLIETLTIPIDQYVEPTTFAMQYKDSNLYWWNQSRRTITKIDLEQKVAGTFLTYKREGPDGVGNAFGFYLHNEDSIFLPSTARNLIHLVNGDGEVVTKYDYSSDTAMFMPTPSYSRFGSQFITYGKSVYFLNTPGYIEYDQIGIETLKSYIPFLRIDLAEHTIVPTPIRFPASILTEEKVSFRTSMSSHKNTLFAKHLNSNLLYIIDLNNHKLSETELQSNFAKNYSYKYMKNAHAKGVDEFTRDLHLYSESLGFTYDAFKKLYYHFVWPGDEIPKDKSALDFSKNLPYFVVSVYNEDLELIYEYRVPENTYQAHLYFVNEKGLNLIANHPNDPNAIENEIRIDTYSFAWD